MTTCLITVPLPRSKTTQLPPLEIPSLNEIDLAEDIDLVEEVDLLESIDLEPDSPPTNLDHADFIKWSKAATGYPYSYFECYEDSFLSEIPKEIFQQEENKI